MRIPVKISPFFDKFRQKINISEVSRIEFRDILLFLLKSPNI